MTTKFKPKDIVSAMKKAIKDVPKVADSKPTHRERDMRQEAVDMGSHGAAEYFKEGQVR